MQGLHSSDITIRFTMRLLGEQATLLLQAVPQAGSDCGLSSKRRGYGMRARLESQWGTTGLMLTCRSCHKIRNRNEHGSDLPSGLVCCPALDLWAAAGTPQESPKT